MADEKEVLDKDGNPTFSRITTSDDDQAAKHYTDFLEWQFMISDLSNQNEDEPELLQKEQAFANYLQ